MVKKLLERFMKKKLRKTNQKEFRIEKVIKRKEDKLYVKWKGYDNSFNSWIDKKELARFYRTGFKNTSCFATNKNEQIFPKPFRSFGRNITLKMIFQIMQQKQT